MRRQDVKKWDEEFLQLKTVADVLELEFPHL